jgi:hypothetical protein
VMEELSGLATIVSRTIIMRLQAYRRAADRKLRAPRVVYSSKGALRRPNGVFRSARALVLAVRVTTQGEKGLVVTMPLSSGTGGARLRARPQVSSGTAGFERAGRLRPLPRHRPSYCVLPAPRTPSSRGKLPLVM